MHAPLDVSLGEPWFIPMFDALKSRTTASERNMSMFAYLVDVDLSGDANLFSLHQMTSRSFDEAQETATNTRNQLQNCWLIALRLYCTHPPPSPMETSQFHSQVSRCVASTRVLCFIPDALPTKSTLPSQCLVVAQCTVSLCCIVFVWLICL